MIRAIYGSRANNTKDWCLTLTSPSDVLIAHSINEVTEVVEASEKASLHGAYVALMLSYEAAAAFDQALITHERNSSFPLAWAAVFPNAGDCNSHVQFETYSTSSWSPGVTEPEYRTAVEKVLELIALVATPYRDRS